MRRFLFFLFLVGSIPLCGQQLSLPFFDDFAAPQVKSNFWILGGVERTEGKAILPPSIGVMSFDGRDARGLPYRQDRVEAVGSMDTLTIREMALGQYLPQDSVFLRFFVQPNGRGEAPDPEDSLWVEAKTSTGEWLTIWSLRGGMPTQNFIPVTLPILQPSFFFNGFQFRFRSSGRQSGPFDTWHVDYVYMEAQSTRKPIFFPDIALVESTPSLFRLYRGIPFRTFSRDQSRYLRDSLAVSVRNFREFTSFSQITFSVTGPDTELSFTPPDFQNIPGNRLVSLAYPMPPNWRLAKPGVYRFGVRLETPESNLPTLPSFTDNDTYEQSMSVETTWQYDDGSAEGGADIDRRLGQVAQLFTMPSADTLGGIQMAFSSTFSSLQGRTLLVRVWEATPAGPGSLLYQEPLRITSDSLWRTLIFQQSIVVPAQFYIGWQRLSDQVVPVGLDKNSPLPAGHIWSNTGFSWQSTPLGGSLMIRAVMGALGNVPNQTGEVTALEPERVVRVYPNPTRDWIHWSPTEGTCWIRDQTGRLYHTGSADSGTCRVQDWPTGLYFLTIATKTHTFTQKWVIDR